MEIPAPLKWAGGIIAALMTAGIIGLCFWLVGTLNEVQLALRDVSAQLSARGAIDQRFNAIEQRVTNLERHNQRGEK